jgi:hypothetical protein
VASQSEPGSVEFGHTLFERPGRRKGFEDPTNSANGCPAPQQEDNLKSIEKIFVFDLPAMGPIEGKGGFETGSRKEVAEQRDT